MARRLGRALLRALWLASLRLALARPICATAVKPLDGAPAPSGRAAAGRREPRVPRAPDCLDGLAGPGLPGIPSRRLSMILLTGGPRTASKVIRLVFAEPDPEPRLAIKMARVPEAAAGIIREVRALEAVRSIHPGGFPGVPRVVFFREIGGQVAVGETALTGTPLFRLLRRGNARDLAMQATAWLADFAPRPRPTPADVWWNRLVGTPLADFTRAFSPVLDPGMLRETTEVLEDLPPLPLVCEQRDFGPWNVLVAPDGQLVVLDWESAEVSGLPALDLVYFLSYLAFFLEGTVDSDRAFASYRRTLDSTTPTGRIVAESVAHYVARTGIEASAIRPLRLLTWIIHSRSEHRRLTADAGGGAPSGTALSASLFFRLWTEELRCGRGA
jgi:hypothetical protein